ncbi:hypothetical protein CRP01_23055 [Flavilitoribacter nigricans DSM 23189 = NBRC 102662]|uniref:Uncharacterized protein n=1 Tax=Flavilitoribacter nigricans (strain ATCC 23147 / DSM 23189 / NBRC 102662 / NCIMB 1420 / SS-2) TaxID=1122177 RepID=A0A2D0N7H2_FLAN2|nr:hypothetical protein CRP01_23055 [Flavilitoribacter nigricans DSM 23189 = NBRC 102662]
MKNLKFLLHRLGRLIAPDYISLAVPWSVFSYARDREIYQLVSQNAPAHQYTLKEEKIFPHRILRSVWPLLFRCNVIENDIDIV